MNILISIHHELDGSSGAPGVTVKLAEALEKRGHRVRALSFDDFKWVRGRLRAIAFPWLVFCHVLAHPEYDVLDLSSGDGWVVNAARRLTGWRRGQLSLTRSHGLEQMGHEMYVKRCREGQDRMSWIYPLYGGGYRLWECRQSFALADVSLMLNEVERRYAQQHFNLDAKRTEKVGNGIDECFAHVARRLVRGPSNTSTLSPGAINVAFAGRANFWKGFTFLAEAMVHILARYPSMKLGLFGTGGTVESVLEAFPAHLHGQIVVVPRYENRALPELLAGYHVFAFPSFGEPFGIAPLEAMACGLVPVVAEAPGPAEYIRHGENGLVVPPRDARSLEEAIVSVIESDALRASLRRGAVATAMKYSWSDLAVRYERLYCRHRRQRSTVMV